VTLPTVLSKIVPVRPTTKARPTALNTMLKMNGAQNPAGAPLFVFHVPEKAPYTAKRPKKRKGRPNNVLHPPPSRYSRVLMLPESTRFMASLT